MICISTKEIKASYSQCWFILLASCCCWWWCVSKVWRDFRSLCHMSSVRDDECSVFTWKSSEDNFHWYRYSLKKMKNDCEQVIKLIYTTITGQVGRMFANGLGDLGSIPGHVIPKTLKMVLDTSLLNTQQYKVYISRVKWSNPGKGEAPSPPLRCSSYWKGSLLVALDYDRQQLTITTGPRKQKKQTKKKKKKKNK